VRLHVVGHRFGARLVTAATTRQRHPVASMCLLQAAFSRYGFAKDWDRVATTPSAQ
jgi:alpha-beta hydrolase superfamily lysophospholipase